MPSRKPNGYWKIQKNIEDAFQSCKTLQEVYKKFPSAIPEAKKLGIYDKLVAPIRKNKPLGYWNDKTAQEHALLYSRRCDFEKHCSGGYEYARRRKILDNICSHMEVQFVWTKPLCHEEALKYTSRSEFKKNNPNAYSAARSNKWLDDICAHMKRKIRESGYWNKISNIEKAFNDCETLQELYLKFPRAIPKAKEYGIYDDLSKPLRSRAPDGTYTFQFCKKYFEACSSLKELRTKFPKVYDAALSRRYVEELSKNYPPSTNLKERAIYAIIFEDNSIYIGLTWDYEQRQKHREKANDRIYKKQQKMKFEIIEFGNFMPAKKAQKTEAEFINIARKSGWKVLNKAKAGALGAGQGRYTKKKCHKLAKECRWRSEFQEKYGAAYEVARQNRWLDEICSHMSYKKTPNGTLTKKYCHKLALECNTRSEFEKRYLGAYTKARREKWLDEICSHMEVLRVKWDEIKIMNEVYKYPDFLAFKKGNVPKRNSNPAYQAAKRRNLIPKIQKYYNTSSNK